MKLHPILLALLAASVLNAGPAHRKLADIPFAKIGGRELLLDLYLPEGKGAAPLIVYVHGGAWRAGSKNSMPLADLMHSGYATWRARPSATLERIGE